MHNASEFNCNSCKQLDNKSPIQTHLPKLCALYKEAQRRRRKRDRRGERDRGEHTTQGTKKAKPERETERRRRSAEEEERKAEDKRRARQKVEPHSNFLFFFAAPLSFCITPPEARKQSHLPSRDDPAR